MNKIKPVSYILLVSLFAGLSFFYSCAQTSDTPVSKIDSIATQFQNANQFQGSLLVAQNGKIILNKGYGYADPASGKLNDTNTIYQIGSITKQFTAAVILKLQEEGKLKVTDTIIRFFPGLKNGGSITIHQLLTHRSGLYNYTNDTTLTRDPLSEQELRDFLNKKNLDFEPGSKFSYSNSGYVLAGYIIEKVTGKKYETVVRDLIFRPLGMNSSGFDFINLQSPLKAEGFFDNGTVNKKAKIIDSTIAFAAGAIYSTTGDLLKWINAINQNRILKPDSWKLMKTDYGSKYGYGLVIDAIHEETNIWHNGGIDGFVSNYYNLPVKEIVIISLSNYMQTDLSKLSRTLTAALLDKPYVLPEARKEVKKPADNLSQYKGNYELVPGFVISITVEGDKLMAQATGQDKFQIYPEKENFYFYKVVDAQIEFEKDSNGKVTSLKLFQNGLIQKGIKKGE